MDKNVREAMTQYPLFHILRIIKSTLECVMVVVVIVYCRLAIDYANTHISLQIAICYLPFWQKDPETFENYAAQPWYAVGPELIRLWGSSVLAHLLASSVGLIHKLLVFLELVEKFNLKRHLNELFSAAKV